MSVELDFDSKQVPPSTGFDAIPAGDYAVVISGSEMKETKNGNGHYLQLTFTIIEGDHEGRKLFARLNLNNPSEQAVAIAKSELSAICHAVGVGRIKTSQQIHDIPLTVKVSVRKDKETGNEYNDIKKYMPKNIEAKKPAAPPTTGGEKMPWQKK